MPHYDVEYHASAENRWIASANSGNWESIEDIRNHRQAAMRPYRVRTNEDLPWEFLSISRWPSRYRGISGDGNHTWHDNLDNIPPHEFPVMDCLHMQLIAEPPIPPNPTLAASWRNTMTTTDTATAATTLPDALVDIRVGRHEGRLTLEISAKPLHDLLDSMGAKTSGSMYTDRPSVSYTAVSNSGKMSTELLLKREYPVRVALSGCFDRPPTHQQLKALCESGHQAVNTILSHYQPVDIRYTIVKVVK